MAIVENNAYAAVAACHPAGVLRCQELKNAFISDYWGGDNSALQSGGAQTVSSLLFAVPVLLGAFAGAPLLSRELDSGTFRFAWTQGAGRTRWALSTLVLPALVVLAATGAFTAIFYWYLRPFLALGQVSEMLPLTFALLGVAFAAWTLLAYSLAAFLGAVFRRSVLAMVVTLVLYIVLAIATATAIRPHYATPVTVPSGAVGNAGASSSSGWVISDLEKAPDGQVLSRDDLYKRLPAVAVQRPELNELQCVHHLADQARLHLVDEPAARLAVLGVPAHRGRLAHGTERRAHRCDGLARPPSRRVTRCRGMVNRRGLDEGDASPASRSAPAACAD